MPDYSYLGSGKVYLRELGSPSGLVEVGNCSALSFGVTEEEKEIKDFTQPGGGTYNSVKRISAVEAQMTFNELSPQNLSRAVYGSTATVIAGPVTSEALGAGYKNGFLATAGLPAATPAPVLKPANAAAPARANTTAYVLNAYVIPATANGFYYKATTAGTSGSAIPTWPTTIGATVTDGTVTWTCAGKTALVVNVDYEVRPGGFLILPGASITDGDSFTCDYTRSAADVVQAIVNSGKEYELVFDGLNEARSGKRTRIRAFRVKIGATQSLDLIGEDYAGLEVSGKLLKETSITAAGVSQYFRVDIEQ